MILNERESRHEHVLHVARQMMTAARTAPKGKGVDIIEIAMVTDGDINILWLSGNFWLVSFKISYLCLPLFYETRTTPSCHPSGCAYRQL